ncbi:transcriptional regulator, IclR family [Syntrophus gentianae]|uniref:Transcriptional regulator, IclR family n=1 Tax=Syntrophus gentianae TaxID=43775 RepID=A0A1H7YZR4_9BACT|nr:IclR family transcriptional regulator [Syntrophus gentianae]SEM51224.1 transcriptional regulator, IclR family [Syntrophus gentianae]
MPLTYKSVPAIEKCFAILDLLSKTEKPLGISDISRQLSLNKSTVFNMVYTLVDLDVLDDLGGGKFGFGHHLYKLGNTAGKRSELIQIVHPYLEIINQETKLSAFLGIRSGLHTVLIDKADKAHGIRLSSEIGMQMPLLGGVGIKAMLSLLSQPLVEELIGNTKLVRYAPNSITDKSAYLEAIDKVRREGIAFDREEYMEGLMAVGVPVRTHNRRIQAAIWVVGLMRQLSEEAVLNLSNLLKEIANKINLQME